jgi:hypothetical protein
MTLLELIERMYKLGIQKFQNPRTTYDRNLLIEQLENTFGIQLDKFPSFSTDFNYNPTQRFVSNLEDVEIERLRYFVSALTWGSPAERKPAFCRAVLENETSQVSSSMSSASTSQFDPSNLTLDEVEKLIHALEIRRAVLLTEAE